MESVAKRARAASQELATATLAARNAALGRLSALLLERRAELLDANARDLEAAAATGLDAAAAKRLVLNAQKLDDLAAGLSDVARLPDPLGVESLARTLCDGLELRRASCPLGVLCVIFESRPEALVQIASLALKSGNAVILKGGKEAFYSNALLGEIVRDAAEGGDGAEGRLPRDCVQVVASRDDVAALLAQDPCIDLVIPRGSNRLVREVKAATRIPVLGHADGLCAVYLDAAADEAKAVPLVVDAKAQYPAACNAAETLIVHAAAAARLLPPVGAALLRAGVTLHADAASAAILRADSDCDAAAAAAGSAVVDAAEADWATEWLGLQMSVVVVPSLEAAVRWINERGSHHTDAIVTEDAAAAARFLRGVDSAGCFHNASTRFADGFRFGFGAEVGISTARVHARGPVGLEGLVTYKYKLSSSSLHTVGQMVAPGAVAAPGATVTIGGRVLPALSFAHRDLPLRGPTLAAGAGLEPPAASASVLRRGGCHCGAVRFSVRTGKTVIAWDCNCTVCSASSAKQTHPHPLTHL